MNHNGWFTLLDCLARNVSTESSCVCVDCDKLPLLTSWEYKVGIVEDSYIRIADLNITESLFFTIKYEYYRFCESMIPFEDVS